MLMDNESLQERKLRRVDELLDMFDAVNTEYVFWYRLPCQEVLPSVRL